MDRIRSYLRGWRGLSAGARLGLLLAVLIASVAPLRTGAQDDRRSDAPSWDNAPLVPRHRSEADWLIEAGWKTPAEVYGPFATHEYAVGEQESFIPLGRFQDQAQPFVLAARTDHAYFWFEQGAAVDLPALEETSRFFEERIWPLNNAIYGSEWNPGIDGDPRLHIVSQQRIEPGVMGAFNPVDECPRTICPTSNQREIIYLSLDLAPLGSQEFLTTLAHEHQHLVQYYIDGNEERWFNEGLSQLAEHLNGFSPRYVGGDNMKQFLSQPDHYLNGWATSGLELGRYYGAGYLFMVYLYERFGLDYMKRLAASDYDGLAAVQHTLLDIGHTLGLDDVYADWILANLLDDPYVADGHFYYQTLDLPAQIRPVPLQVASGSRAYSDSLNQYGADYLILDQPGTYDLSFDGSDETLMMGAEPASRDWMWWSYNNSSGAARLTGAFDLSQLHSATLTFNIWWDVEDDYDWFQVLASKNGGAEWQVVTGQHATPQGLSEPGAFYSGRSGRWVDEQIDLSAYVGGPVLIRFEYLTDSASTREGVAVDDIGIRELGYVDDVENPRSVWNPEGFLRVPARVAQRWTVALVEKEPGQHAAVQHLALDALNTGRAAITVPPGGSVTLVIGAMAPFTSTPTDYKLTLRRQG